MNNEKDIKALISAVEKSERVERFTSKRFEHLAQRIYARTHKMIGVTTLKRLWGYVDCEQKPRTTTLDILAEYIGYKSFHAFCRAYEEDGGTISSYITLGECMYCDDMEIGDIFRLTWAPCRVCDVEYRGNNTFLVVYSENTKLEVGAVFKCYVFENGEQLFIDHLFMKNTQKEPMNYVAGRLGGIHYEKLD